MKLFLGISLLLLLSLTSKGQAPDTIYNQLVSINLKSFVNKPVDSLLVKLPSGYILSFIPGRNGNKVRFLFIQYNGGSNITFHVKNYQYMNPIDPNWVWDLSLFKKENLFYVSLVHPDHNSITSRDIEAAKTGNN